MPKQMSADDLLWSSQKEVLITPRAQALADSDADIQAELHSIIQRFKADMTIHEPEYLEYWIGLDNKLRIYAKEEQYNTFKEYVRYDSQ